MYKSIKELDIYISDGNYSSKYPRSEEFVDEGIPFIRGNNMIDGEIVDEDMYHITEEKHSILLKGHVQTGDILITTRGNIGQVAIVQERHNDSNINAQIVLLRVNKEELYNRYLLWALQAQKSKEQYLTLQTGTALKQLPVGKLEQVKIKYVDLQMQFQVAEILDKVYQIIKVRRKEFVALDNLIKARFVEMFGNLHDNESEFDVVTIEDVCSLIKDGTHQTPQYTEDKEKGYKFLSSKDVMSQKIDWTDIRYISAELHEKLYATIKPQRNDVLMSKNGVNYGVAAVNDTDEVFDIYVSLALLRPKEIINPVFFRCVINNPETKRQFDSSIKGIGVPNLHLGEIKKTKIFLPPLELQEEFVTFVHQVDKSKAAVQKALDEAQLLFDSLMQKYFG